MEELPESERFSLIYNAWSVEKIRTGFRAYVEDLKQRENSAAAGFVTDSIYWAINEGQFLGRISLRHELNEKLERLGGHVGYIVAKQSRGKGIASEMLRQLLMTPRAQQMGRLLVTCDDSNGPSIRVIQKNRGVYCDAVDMGNGNPRKLRFWINLVPIETLRTDRLVLDRFRDEDAGGIFQYASNPEVAKTVTWEAHQTIEDSRAFLSQMNIALANEKDRMFRIWAIRLGEQTPPIGSITLTQRSDVSAQIDYALSRDHWNKGLMTEAVRRVVSWAFERGPGLERITSQTLTDNFASQRVLEKSGFQFEGVSRSAMRVKSQLVDLAGHAIIRKSWVAQNAPIYASVTVEGSTKTERVLGDVLGFFEKIFAALEATEIDLSSFTLDHVCYRTQSIATYERRKTEMSGIGDLLAESEVNGRSIATYRLQEPIVFRRSSKLWMVSLVEIPAPKPGKSTIEGLEHVEFTIAENLSDFVTRHPQISFNTSGLHKPLNPEVEVTFDDLAVKFHNMPLARAIEIEKSALQAQRFAADLKARYECHTVILYGSRATQNFQASSDFDILAFRDTKDGDPALVREAKFIDKAYLDAWIYSDQKRLEPDDSFLRACQGQVIIEREHQGQEFLAKMIERQSNPRSLLPAQEIELHRSWIKKMLTRASQGDLEARFRQQWLLVDLLQLYFDLRAIRYSGPKAALSWLQSHDRVAYSHFKQALERPGDWVTLRSLAIHVMGDIDETLFDAGSDGM